MLPSTTVVIRELRFWYNKSNIRYIFCNEHFKAFLEGQKSSLLVIRNLLFWCSDLVIFFCTVFILYTCNYKSLVKSFIQFFFKMIWMLSNKMFPLSTSSNNICCKEALMNIDNFKKPTRSSTKHCNSRNFSILQKVLQNVLSFLHKFISREFFMLPKVFYTTKNVNIVRTHTEMN